MLLPMLAVLTWAGGVPKGMFTVSSPALSVQVQDGMVVNLTNKRTGEQLVTLPRQTKALSGLFLTGDRTWKSDTASEVRVTQEARGGSARTLQMTWKGQGRLTTHWLPAHETVEVRQQGSAEADGLFGASWGIAMVPERVQLLVPSHSGLRFGPDAPWGTHVLEYPMSWEAPFVVLQGQRGGVLIHAVDPELSPKALIIERVNGGFLVRFESRNEAPFDRLRRIRGKPWRMVAYSGPWQTGAALYRRWAEQAYGLKPLTQRRPRWASDIRFVVFVTLKKELLEPLARRVDPRRTLLYIPDWRKDGYDRNYPDYTPVPEFGPFIREAHRLGFRVMPHVNYFGCDPKNPEYERFRAYHLRDPFTKEHLWWEWPAEPPIKFAYINPASRAWRQLFVERMVALVNEFNLDALHLDQSMVIVNDANGRIDGMTCAEGNIALHRELKAALPDVALSGEGLNEITCRYEDFTQRHVYGMDHTRMTWSERLIRMAHPVSSAVLLPNTAMYGYLGMVNPVQYPTVFLAFLRAYSRLGILPTYPWPSLGELGPDQPILVRQVFERAAMWLRYDPKPDWTGPWAPQELFVWNLAGGGRLRYVDLGGLTLQIRRPGQREYETLERRIHDVETIRIGGSIPGWPAYDEQSLLGLDPRQDYDWTPDPRDLRRLHLRAVPSGWHVSVAGDHPDLWRVRVTPHARDLVADIRLWEPGVPLKSGVTLPDGKEVTFDGLEMYDTPSGGTVRPEGEGIFMHPPWKFGTRPPGNGHRVMSFLEYRLRLPDLPDLRFEARGHVQTGAKETDGVRFTFRVRAIESGLEASCELLAVPGEPQPFSLNLEPFRGQQVVLRLEADPGPNGDPSFDWGRVDRPRIFSNWEAVKPVKATLRLGGEEPVRGLLTARGTGQLRTEQGTLLADVELPDTLIIPRGEPLRLAASGDGAVLLNLRDLPLKARARAPDGREHTRLTFPPDVSTGTTGGEERPAISAHPPEFGATILDYHLLLPDVPCRLETAIGIGDGSRSTGVGFRVEVNGHVVFARDIKPPTGWIPVVVDLSPYRGQEIVLSLVTDALDGYHFDWALWGDPRIVSGGDGSSEAVP